MLLRRTPTRGGGLLVWNKLYGLTRAFRYRKAFMRTTLNRHSFKIAISKSDTI